MNHPFVIRAFSGAWCPLFGATRSALESAQARACRFG